MKRDLDNNEWIVSVYALKGDTEPVKDGYSELGDALEAAVLTVEEREPYAIKVRRVDGAEREYSYSRDEGWRAPNCYEGLYVEFPEDKRSQLNALVIYQDRKATARRTINPTGFIVLDEYVQPNGRTDALLYCPGQPSRFFIATGYDAEKGEWSAANGYTNDLTQVSARANPDILDNAMVVYRKDDLREALVEAGMPAPNENDIEELKEAADLAGEMKWADEDACMRLRECAETVVRECEEPLEASFSLEEHHKFLASDVPYADAALMGDLRVDLKHGGAQEGWKWDVVVANARDSGVPEAVIATGEAETYREAQHQAKHGLNEAVRAHRRQVWETAAGKAPEIGSGKRRRQEAVEKDEKGKTQLSTPRADCEQKRRTAR